MIKYLKLVDGTNIIADCEEITETTKLGHIDGASDEVTLSLGRVKLKQPVRLGLAPAEKGMGLGMEPFNMFGKSDTVEINLTHILFIDEPLLEIQNVYNEKFGSGIVTAPANLKL